MHTTSASKSARFIEGNCGNLEHLIDEDAEAELGLELESEWKLCIFHLMRLQDAAKMERKWKEDSMEWLKRISPSFLKEQHFA